MKFKEPLTADLQGAINSYKLKALVTVLKHSGEYSIYYGLVIRIYINLRSFGMRISLLQGKVLALLLAASVAGTAIAGAYAVIRVFAAEKPPLEEKRVQQEKTGFRVMKKEPGKQKEKSGDINKQMERVIPDRKNSNLMKKPERREHESNGPPENDKKKGKNEVPSATNRYRLGVETFTGEALNSGNTERITSIIAGELMRIKGKDKVIRTGTSRKNVNLMLIGSVEKLGVRYLITGKLVDVESSKILFTASESISSKPGIEKACRKLAGRIAEEIK